jgi:hypothetical protein
MNVNDRLALELGRAILRAIAAESQRDEAIAKLAEQPGKDDEPRPT